ncbi:hypothetical protein L2E82_33909 [Cichorium intybus]|uniref:Uncharacterized protein n=1 Tax=Cichorium intybus TaxID=13427 RepID=A0ACB9BL98_CICIN|nr:hypothetical protein L2E82_33909 [Cichorium intybus]
MDNRAIIFDDENSAIVSALQNVICGGNHATPRSASAVIGNSQCQPSPTEHEICGESVSVIFDDENSAIVSALQYVICGGNHATPSSAVIGNSQCQPSTTEHEICVKCGMRIPSHCLGCQMFTAGSREETRRRTKKKGHRRGVYVEGNNS